MLIYSHKQSRLRIENSYPPCRQSVKIEAKTAITHIDISGNLLTFAPVITHRIPAMDKISATIITRNEESQIERCLNSLQGVADEIIVVDSYSTDRTVEICHRYGCQVTCRVFTGFGSQRQYAVGLTHNSFVLAIDADEVLSDELRRELIKMKNDGFSHRVYRLNIVNYFCGKAINHSGWQPATDIRLFNKRYANWNLHDLGERVTFDPLLIPHPITKGRIDHFRVNTDDEFIKKEQRRSSMQARMLTGENRRISIFTPIFRAWKDFMTCYLAQAAFLDGRQGNIIAMRRCSSTFKAYSIARSILNKRRRH